MSQITPILLLCGCVSVALGAGAAEAGPELNRDQVKAVIEDAYPDIKLCNPDSAVEIVKVKWVIEPEGNTTKVKVEGKHADTDIGRCVKKKVAALRFGHSIKSTPVTYPFKLGDTVTLQDKRAAQASSGKLTPKDLDGLLSILEGDIKKCGSEGKVRAKFVIRPTGRVKGVVVKDADDQKVEDCVTQRITRVRFPAPDKATPVNRTFELGEPAKQPAEADAG